MPRLRLGVDGNILLFLLWLPEFYLLFNNLLVILKWCNEISISFLFVLNFVDLIYLIKTFNQTIGLIFIFFENTNNWIDKLNNL